jgi:hypothetical protein
MAVCRAIGVQNARKTGPHAHTHSDISLSVLAATALTQVPQAAHSYPPTAYAAAGNAVLAWNANAGKAATAACIAPLTNPLHESRIYAIMHIATHDALNAIPGPTCSMDLGSQLLLRTPRWPRLLEPCLSR